MSGKSGSSSEEIAMAVVSLGQAQKVVADLEGELVVLGAAMTKIGNALQNLKGGLHVREGERLVGIPGTNQSDGVYLHADVLQGLLDRVSLLNSKKKEIERCKRLLKREAGADL